MWRDPPVGVDQSGPSRPPGPQSAWPASAGWRLVGRIALVALAAAGWVVAAALVLVGLVDRVLGGL